jgi:hypothetical protein
MDPRSNKRLFRLPAIVLAALLSGCDMLGLGDGEFVQACLDEGKRGVNKRFSDEMGIDRETFCKCAAGEARANLSQDGYRAMILDMQGKGQEARDVSSKMNSSERMAFLEATLKIFGKCAMGERG